MSRLTSAQVIGLGEYLNPDFDPASLTVSQLLGVLGFHNVKYPSTYTKPKLVQLFNDEIKANSNKLKKERRKKENSQASDEGITDGLTGQPITARKAPPVRRSSRRLSRTSSREQETSPVRPDPPKRRRSSAQPNLGGDSHKVAFIQPPLFETSEPEEDDLPIRKIGRRTKATEAAGSQARRVSQPATEDSGWEDNNIFQSGAESSSPLRPSPSRSKAARKSVVSRRPRKSTSAPPQIRLSSSPTQPSHSAAQEDRRLSPPQSKFEPQLPSTVSRETRVITAKTDRTNLFPIESFRPGGGTRKKEDSDESNFLVGDSAIVTRDTIISEESAEGDGEDVEGDSEEEQTVAVSRRIAQGGKALTRSRSSSVSGSKSMSLFFRILITLAIIMSSSALYKYKVESASIGYCDQGSNTNRALEDLKEKWKAVEACNRENRTLLYLPPLSGKTAKVQEGIDLTPCPLPPLIPFPHPTTCTPCPEHAASCTQNRVTCNAGYLLRPHPLLFFLPASASPSAASFSLSSSPVELIWKIISEVTDGLPGLGSVGLPPRCVEDPKRKRNIGVLGKAIEAKLGQERGRRVCAGERVGHGDGDVGKDADGGEAKRWGVEVEKLRDVMKKKTAPHLLATFDDTFNEAVQQLLQWGGVIIGEDSSGKRYLAHKTPDLTWSCALTVKSRDMWVEWRATVFGVVMILISIYFAKSRRAQRQVERKRIAELVQIALDTLRHQELAHHTDPVTAPQAYLSSLQLRDLILQDEHLIPTRRRLWDQVERVVESNANVRVNLEEVPGGDEMRVWRWVGSAGRTTVKQTI